jgi:hypothetical protein
VLDVDDEENNDYGADEEGATGKAGFLHAPAPPDTSQAALEHRAAARELHQDSGASFYTVASGSEAEVDRAGILDVQDNAYRGGDGKSLGNAGEPAGERMPNEDAATSPGPHAGKRQGSADEGVGAGQATSGQPDDDAATPQGRGLPRAAISPGASAGSELAEQSLKGVQAFLSRAAGGRGSASAALLAARNRGRSSVATSGGGSSSAGGGVGRDSAKGSTPGSVSRQRGILSYFRKGPG